MNWFRKWFPNQKLIKSEPPENVTPDNIHDNSPYREKLRQEMRDAIKVIYNDGGIDLKTGNPIVEELRKLGYTVRDGREYVCSYRYVTAPINLKITPTEVNRMMFED